MGDWADTVEDREKGEVVGFVGHNEPIDAGAAPAVSKEEITDVRRVAVDNVEAAGGKVPDVVQPPAVDSNPSERTSGTGTVESTGGDDGKATDPLGGGEPVNSAAEAARLREEEARLREEEARRREEADNSGNQN